MKLHELIGYVEKQNRKKLVQFLTNKMSGGRTFASKLASGFTLEFLKETPLLCSNLFGFGRLELISWRV